MGTKFLEWVCEYHKEGNGRCRKKLPTLFHTSHPQLIGYLNASTKWVLKSQQMNGGNKVKSGESIREARVRNGSKMQFSGTSGYGGHFRAVQGFKYVGTR